MADTTTEYTTTTPDDTRIQHGIDNSPTGDAEKGATGGAIGGAIVGATAGAMVGPAGALLGAAIGGVVGGLASGEAVAIVDRHDNDNTISGLGTTPTVVHTDNAYANTADTYATTTTDNTYATTNAPLTYGTPVSDTYAVRDAAYTDTTTGGIRAAADSGIGTGVSRETELGEHTPSFKTGGVANDGTPDTRGIGEKLVDGLTGDDIDDKTGKIVDHP